MLTISKLNEKNIEDFQLCLKNHGIEKVEVESVILQHQNYFLLKDGDDIIGYAFFNEKDDEVILKEIQIFEGKEEKLLMIDLLLKSVINAAEIRGQYWLVINKALLKDDGDWLKNMGFEEKEKDMFYMDVKKYFTRKCDGCDNKCSH